MSQKSQGLVKTGAEILRWESSALPRTPLPQNDKVNETSRPGEHPIFQFSEGRRKVRVFIVHAHHEPKSFNGAMSREACAALQAAGHEVVVSDLYAMGFNPLSDRRNFVTIHNPDFLRQQAEETHASEQDGFAPDLKAEMDKLFWCDALIFQFPLWWFGLPAILKGWVDRVFAMGRVYGGGRFYDHGVFDGKRAMCSVTIGGSAPLYSEYGLNGPISSILFPINHGIFYFTGFTVIEPFLVYAPARLSQQEREGHLKRYRDRALALASAPILGFPKLAEYDERRILKSAARRVAHWPSPNADHVGS